LRRDTVAWREAIIRIPRRLLRRARRQPLEAAAVREGAKAGQGDPGNSAADIFLNVFSADGQTRLSGDGFSIDLGSPPSSSPLYGLASQGQVTLFVEGKASLLDASLQLRDGLEDGNLIVEYEIGGSATDYDEPHFHLMDVDFREAAARALGTTTGDRGL